MDNAANIRPLTCQKCGVSLPAGTKRCDYCGSPLLAYAPERAGVNHLTDQAIRFGFAWVWAAVGLGIALIGALVIGRILLRSAERQAEYEWIVVNGVMIEAQVVDKVTRYQNEATYYEMTVRFMLSQDGQPVERTFTQTVSAANYHSLVVGQRTQVFYIPSGPERVVLNPAITPPDRRTPVYQALYLSLMVLLGLGAAGYGARRLYVLRQLTRRGERTMALVTQVRSLKDPETGRRYVIHFKFRAMSPKLGREIAVKGRRSRSTPYRFKAGELIPVCYLPENPKNFELMA